MLRRSHWFASIFALLWMYFFSPSRCKVFSQYQMLIWKPQNRHMMLVLSSFKCFFFFACVRVCAALCEHVLYACVLIQQTPGTCKFLFIMPVCVDACAWWAYCCTCVHNTCTPSVCVRVCVFANVPHCCSVYKNGICCCTQSYATLNLEIFTHLVIFCVFLQQNKSS